MSEHYKFFSHKECEFYPCHKGIEEMNCLFCYCPFYKEIHCPGNPLYIDGKTGKIKDCSMCIFPHKKENYDAIIEYLQR